MIKDKVAYSALYEGVNPGFKAAFAFLKEALAQPKEVGRYELGDGVFALVQSYDTKAEENCKIEAHKKYIDIQCVLKGKELFGVADLSTQTMYEDKFAEKDVAFYKGEVDLLTLTDGDFVIVFPEDAHRPQQGDGSHVEKVVVKVPMVY
ncbi:MAG: YhcH/YjgK/YiaL family protein [Clostridia bacterium]|nr:YhcH/YjgK/YiaL family protein [Clostridia bacterium]